MVALVGGRGTKGLAAEIAQAAAMKNLTATMASLITAYSSVYRQVKLVQQLEIQLF